MCYMLFGSDSYMNFDYRYFFAIFRLVRDSPVFRDHWAIRAVPSMYKGKDPTDGASVKATKGDRVMMIRNIQNAIPVFRKSISARCCQA